VKIAITAMEDVGHPQFVAGAQASNRRQHGPVGTARNHPPERNRWGDPAHRCKSRLATFPQSRARSAFACGPDESSGHRPGGRGRSVCSAPRSLPPLRPSSSISSTRAQSRGYRRGRRGRRPHWNGEVTMISPARQHRRAVHLRTASPAASIRTGNRKQHFTVCVGQQPQG